jgi:hypothetical protein
MGGDIIKVIIQFLDVFSMIALVVAEPKQTLFQNEVFAVP